MKCIAFVLAGIAPFLIMILVIDWVKAIKEGMKKPDWNKNDEK